MSNVLKRIQAAQKRELGTIDSSAQNFMEQYVAELRAEERSTIEKELRQQLIESANSAEIESLRQQIASIQQEKNTVQETLIQARTDIGQLKDTINSLNSQISQMRDEAKMAEKEVEEPEDNSEYEDRIKMLENALAEAAKKPPTIITKEAKQNPLPSFEFIPVRGPDGRTVSVTAKPI